MTAFTSISRNLTLARAAAIGDVLFPAGQGIIIDPATLVLQGAAPAIGYYDGSLSADLGIGAGLILTSGTMPGTANTVGFFGKNNALPGDQMLDAVVNTVFPTVSYDAASISASFTVTDPTITSVSFSVVFGSDEFPEWVDQFVDIAAIWVNGTDYAYFNNDPRAPLSVIGANLAANYFIDNTGNLTTAAIGGVAKPGVTSKLPIEYDGVSAPLTITAPVHQGVNTLKIAIADTRDHIYDSGIIVSNLRGGNLPTTGITLDVEGSEVNDDQEGSDTPETLNGKGGDDLVNAGGGDDVVLSGTGDDYIVGGAGNDYIDGGEGTDTATYSGGAADYTIAANAGGSTTVTDNRAGSPDGKDTLVNVEIIQFADVTLSLATGQPVAAVVAPVAQTPPAPPAPPPPAPPVLPAAADPIAVAATEDGQIVSAGAFDGVGLDDEGLSVTGLPATLPAGVTYNDAVHSFFLDPSDAAYQALAAGEQTTMTVAYGVSNGTNTAATSVVFTVTGVNDAPTVSGPTAVAVTAGGPAIAVNALAHAADADHGAVLSVVSLTGAAQAANSAEQKHGADDIPATGTPPSAGVDPNALPAGVTFDAASGAFSIDPAAPAYQALAAGETTTVTVNYGVSDGAAITPAAIVMTITGVNDAPVVSGPVTGLFVNEDGAAGAYDLSRLLSTAHDPDTGGKLSVIIDASSLPAGVSYASTPEQLVPGHTVPAHVIPAGPRATGWGNYVYPAEFVPAVVVPDSIIPATITLSIDPSDAAYQSLAQGEELAVVVDYLVTDGSLSTPAQAIFTVNGMNDAPVVAGPVTAAATEDGATVFVDALSGATDVDRDSVLSLVGTPVRQTATPASDSPKDIAEAAALTAAAPLSPTVFDPSSLPAGVTYDQAAHRFTLDPSNAAYQYLSAGETAQVVVNYGVSDGITATAASTVFTVTGTEDAPVVSGAVTGLTVNEDTKAGYAAAALLANASDADRLDTLTVVVDPAALPAGVHWVTTPGQVIPGAGYYAAPVYLPPSQRLELDGTDPRFQSLALGETIQIIVSYNVSDGAVPVPASAVFTVVGQNDAPVISGPVTAAAAEDGAVVTAAALANAVDVDHGSSLSVTGVPAVLPAGVTYDAAAGTFSLDPANAVYQSLSAGQTTQVTVAYGVTDGIVTSSASVVFTVTGANDTPVVGAPRTFAVTAGAAAFTPNPVANVTDPDTADVPRVVSGPLGTGVRLAWIPGGYYQPPVQITQFDPSDPAFRVLAAGEVATYTWAYDVTDGIATVHDSAVFTVTGVNDAPVVSGSVGGTVLEDAPILTVDALSNAADDDHGAVLSVVNVTAVLPAGVTYDTATHSFSLNPADPSFQPLAQGETLSIVVPYGVSDGMVTTAASAVFTVTGVNDAPVVAGAVVSTPNEGSGVVTINPLGTASDVDAHQGLHVRDLPATLPAGLTFNAATDRFAFDSNDAAYDSLSAGETLNLTVSYGAYDGFVSVPASTVISVQGKNDLPVVSGVVEGGTVQQSAAPVTLSLLSKTTDVDRLDVLSVSAVKGGPGNAVTAAVTSGTWTSPIAFTLANNQVTVNPAQFASLAAGSSVGITFSYTVTDGNQGVAVAASAHLTVQGQYTGPSGVAVTPAIASVGKLLGGSGLNAKQTVAALGQIGGLAGDAYSFALSGTGAGSFAIVTSSGVAQLQTGASGAAGAAGGQLYALKVTATDTTAGLSAPATPVNVVVGSGKNSNTIALASVPGLVSSAPTFIYDLGGSDTINGSGLTGKLYFDGGQGADTMTAGSGVNTFVYAGTSDSTASAMDIIANFHAATDILDFTALGSKFGVTALASNATTIAGGTIGWQTSGGNTFVYANTGGGSAALASANMKIELLGNVALTGANIAHL